jgi:hypothetical protein
MLHIKVKKTIVIKIPEGVCSKEGFMIRTIRSTDIVKIPEVLDPFLSKILN